MVIEYVPGQIWLKEYPIHYMGTRFDSRMTVIRLPDGRLIVHLNVGSAQAAYPQAETFICPGLERKRPGNPWRESSSGISHA